MAKVTFTQTDGTEKTVDASNGDTLLETAKRHHVPMESACGGNGFCTTCLCRIKEGKNALDTGKISPVNDKEKNMGIEGPELRLGCQARVRGDVAVEIGVE